MIHWAFSSTHLGQWCNRIHLNRLKEAIGPPRHVLLGHQDFLLPNVRFIANLLPGSRWTEGTKEHARIAVVRGASSATIQEIFQSLADRWSRSARVAGVLAEHHGLVDRACSAGFLRSILTGERFPIFQDLGPGSTTCHLDGGAMLSATEAVQRDIAAGCELVVLNKFGKLEAANSGLADAFGAAIDAWWQSVRSPVRVGV